MNLGEKQRVGLLLLARSIVRQVTLPNLTVESYCRSLAKDIVYEVTAKVRRRLRRQEEEQFLRRRISLAVDTRTPEERGLAVFNRAFEATGRRPGESLESWLRRFESVVLECRQEGLELEWSLGRLFRELKERAPEQ